MATPFTEPETQPTSTVLQLLGVVSADDETLLELTETGIPLSRLPILIDLGLTRAERNALVIPARTLAYRRAADSRLNRDESDRFLRVLRCLVQGRQIFGGPEKALRWLRKAKSGLGGRTPLAALETETGARLVEEWLVRIDQGMAA
jgi:putative toxin-antitoxin system antitoxin component (TIGR02293 family)